ncbi:MAG: PAS domain S-box protein [Deltaproteobacteria bacterium]|nr:PAS domain S-box protein [Deltaproteobacteria bacterium]
MSDQNLPRTIETLQRKITDLRKHAGQHSEQRYAELPQILEELNRVIETLRLAEQPLQNQAEHYRLLVEGCTDYAIFMLDPGGNVVSWNAGAERIKGYRAEEIIGKHFSCFYPRQDVETGKPDQVLHMAAAMGRHQDEGWRLRKDGSRFWANVVMTALRNEAGQLHGFAKVTRDVTERRRVAARLRSLIDTTQDAVIFIDRQGRIDLFNPAAERIFGYTRAEVQGQKVQMLMPEPYASEHDGYIERYKRTGEPHAIGRIRSVAARRKSSEVFPIEISVAELGDDEDMRYAALVRDVSERVKLQEQLLERERLASVGTTAAILAHEIGSPLNGISLAVQLLEKQLTKQHALLDDKITALLDRIAREIRRLTLLLDEYRALTRDQRFDLQPTSLMTVVTDVLAVETQHYATLGVHVEQEIPSDLPLLVADSHKLKQVVLNLCKNAVEAMPDGGTLTVRAYDSGRQLCLEVSDTGVGIPAGIDIFAAFTTTKPHGTGLGLAVVRQIIEAHKGTLTYHSVPGQGTTFTLTLPISQSETG